MKRNIPSLKSLQIFEAAAKKESFSEAAETLFLTQSAISKQIKLLEEQLGTRLFNRKGGTVYLTTEGKEYLDIIVQGLDIIESGSNSFYKKQAKEELIIDITPSISALWIFSRVEKFHALHSSITLRINSADDAVDWSKKRVDIIIRCLPDKKRHLDAEVLNHENLKLIISPSLLNKKPIHSLKDLYKHTLLQLNNRPYLWKQTFEKYDLNIDGNAIGFGCEHFYMVVQVVLNDFGIAMVPDFLCEDLLQQGKLANPLNISIRSGYSYHLMTPPHKKNEKNVINFYTWIKDQLKAYQQ